MCVGCHALVWIRSALVSFANPIVAVSRTQPSSYGLVYHSNIIMLDVEDTSPVRPGHTNLDTRYANTGLSGPGERPAATPYSALGIKYQERKDPAAYQCRCRNHFVSLSVSQVPRSQTGMAPRPGFHASHLPTLFTQHRTIPAALPLSQAFCGTLWESSLDHRRRPEISISIVQSPRLCSTISSHSTRVAVVVERYETNYKTVPREPSTRHSICPAGAWTPAPDMYFEVHENLCRGT
jgi:hypothetical protein